MDIWEFVFIQRVRVAITCQCHILGQVVVELAWDLPTDHVVTVDMWMSSASIASMKFIKDDLSKWTQLH